MFCSIFCILWTSKVSDIAWIFSEKCVNLIKYGFIYWGFQSMASVFSEIYLQGMHCLRKNIADILCLTRNKIIVKRNFGAIDFWIWNVQFSWWNYIILCQFLWFFEFSIRRNHSIVLLVQNFCFRLQLTFQLDSALSIIPLAYSLEKNSPNQVMKDKIGDLVQLKHKIFIHKTKRHILNNFFFLVIQNICKCILPFHIH